VEVKIRGVARVTFIFQNLTPKLQEALPDALVDFANMVFQEVLRRAPVRFGHLRDSVRLEVDKEALIARIGPTIEYGPFVTYPTRPHAINARVMISPGIFRFIKMHPGTPGNPYLEESLMAIQPELPKVLQPYVVSKFFELDRESVAVGGREE